MNRIKELRIKNKLKQKELAEILQTNASSVCSWEKGDYNPNSEQLIKLSKYFNCSVDYLMGYSDVNLKEDITNNSKNTVIILGRDNSGRTEFTVSDKELKIIQKLMESMKDVPDDDNF